MLIPDAVRVPVYKDNLISGLAMYMWGPELLRLIFRGFVVVVGFLILSGAVNTAIIGSNGVLNRVSEDGVLADWFRFPHRKYGTSSRIINLVVILQIFTILASRGDVYVLGEAYAFGVIWSFTFNSLAMLVLRFKYKGVARLEGSRQHHHRRTRNAHRPGLGLPRSARDCAREPGHEIRRYRRGCFFLGGFLRDLHRFRTREPEKIRARQSSR